MLQLKTLETNLYHTLDYSGPYNHDHQLPRRRQHLLRVGGLMDSLLTTLVQLALNLRDKFQFQRLFLYTSTMF